MSEEIAGHIEGGSARERHRESSTVLFSFSNLTQADQPDHHLEEENLKYSLMLELGMGDSKVEQEPSEWVWENRCQQVLVIT